MKQKALLMLSPGFAASEADTVCIPGQQNFVRALLRNFPGTRILVLAFQYPFHNTPYNWEAAEVIPFNGQNKGKMDRLKLWIRIWKTMWKLRKEYQLLGILSFWCTECALLGTWFGRLTGLKHMCWIWGQDARKSNDFVRWIRPKPAELVAMSDFLAMEFYRSHNVYPQYMVPNNVDENLFPPLPVVRDIDVLGVGSLIPLKQFDMFIDAVKKLAIERPGLKAMICGDGPGRETLMQQISKAGLDNVIELAGERSNPEVLELMQRSKILLHCSSYEGFSTVCLEALYAGAHIISFVRPMDSVAEHHHIVHDRTELDEKLWEVLSREQDHARILLFSANDTSKKMMSLFLDKVQADIV